MLEPAKKFNSLISTKQIIFFQLKKKKEKKTAN